MDVWFTGMKFTNIEVSVLGESLRNTGGIVRSLLKLATLIIASA
jgi:hypothetical protein